jgi:hypothetical protein
MLQPLSSPTQRSSLPQNFLGSYPRLCESDVVAFDAECGRIINPGPDHATKRRSSDEETNVPYHRLLSQGRNRAPFDLASISALQRTAGNAAVSALLQRSSVPNANSPSSDRSSPRHDDCVSLPRARNTISGFPLDSGHDLSLTSPRPVNCVVTASNGEVEVIDSMQIDQPATFRANDRLVSAPVLQRAPNSPGGLGTGYQVGKGLVRTRPVTEIGCPRILDLQRQAGNQAVTPLLAGRHGHLEQAVQREPITRRPRRDGKTSADPVRELEQVDGVWCMKLQGFAESGAVAGYIWPAGPPPGVRIVPTVVVEKPVQIGLFEITGVTTDGALFRSPQ